MRHTLSPQWRKRGRQTEERGEVRREGRRLAGGRSPHAGDSVCHVQRYVIWRYAACSSPPTAVPVLRIWMREKASRSAPRVNETGMVERLREANRKEHRHSSRHDTDGSASPTRRDVTSRAIQHHRMEHTACARQLDHLHNSERRQTARKVTG